MKTVFRGQAAEKAVAKKLSDNGFKIRAINWRTSRCEIDIIAEKDQVVYFVEVKYRASDFQGGGLDYITNKKLKQMTFAAELWSQFNNYYGDRQLMAASVSGDYLVEEIIEL
jgi:putative endonuclease